MVKRSIGEKRKRLAAEAGEAGPAPAAEPEAEAESLAASTKRDGFALKRKNFLQKVKLSAHSAKATIAKRGGKAQQKKRGATLNSLGSLADALPGVSVIAKPMPAFLLSAAGKVVRSKARVQRCQTESVRMAAVMADKHFAEDPIAAVTRHILASVSAAMGSVSGGGDAEMGTGGKARRDAKAAAKKLGQAAGGAGMKAGKKAMHVGVSAGGGIQKQGGRHKKKH